MDFIEVSISTTKEGLEIVSGTLYANGITGLMINDTDEFREFIEKPDSSWDLVEEGLAEQILNEGTSISFFVSDNASGMEQLNAIKSALKVLKENEKEFDLGTLELKIKNVKEEDWANNWKKYFKPTPIGSRLIIKPSWEEVENPEGKVILNIDPGHVFGTGTHETTRMCIEHIENFVKEGDKVLDIGCGSGILSIAALLMGAAHADAIDIDPNAVETAYENAAMNGIDKSKYEVISGNILESEELFNKYKGGDYDVVVANIIADVVIALAVIVGKFMKKGGVFIMSGIITDRLEDVFTALTRSRFEVMDIKIDKDWASVVAIYTGQLILRL